MSLVARRITDKGALFLIRRFLQSGVLLDGLTSPTMEGTPQGGPLSPLLSNIMLKSWKSGAIASVATPTIVTSTFGHERREKD